MFAEYTFLLLSVKMSIQDCAQLRFGNRSSFGCAKNLGLPLRASMSLRGVWDFRDSLGQVVIALTPTSFIVWPNSHHFDINKGGTKFYTLSKGELSALAKANCSRAEIAADVGDVMFFIGGKVVHGSPGVPAGEAARIMTYAHWAPSR